MALSKNPSSSSLSNKPNNTPDLKFNRILGVTMAVAIGVLQATGCASVKPKVQNVPSNTSPMTRIRRPKNLSVASDERLRPDKDEGVKPDQDENIKPTGDESIEPDEVESIKPDRDERLD